jgi:hypothetical protein
MIDKPDGLVSTTDINAHALRIADAIIRPKDVPMFRKRKSKSLIRVRDALNDVMPFTNPEIVSLSAFDAVQLAVMPLSFELITQHRGAMWFNFTMIRNPSTGDFEKGTEPTPIPAARDDLNGVVTYMCEMLTAVWVGFAKKDDTSPVLRTIAMDNLKALETRMQQGPPPTV